MSETNDMVARHYSEIENKGLAFRGDSKILQMKNFNNWVKSVLIKSYCSPGYYALDICGGKGGDLPKWLKGNIGCLVLADVATGSVQHACDRYNERKHDFHATFISADCCAVSLANYLPDLDFVSCQFSLHYSFESEERARMLLQNITCKLKPGGYFVGTIPDANSIVKRIRASDSLSFGNSVFSIKFDQKTNFPLFGAKYEFDLEDAIYSLPEYLVHFPTFVNLAEEFGMELLLKERFHDFYTRIKKYIAIPDNASLFHRMKCANNEGTISPDEWEASGIYLAFAFQKKGADSPTPSPSPPQPVHVRREDIIVLNH